MTNTLKMSLDKTAFLLDRFSLDCGPLQYIRELTQNSIEAIRKAGRERGIIIWGFDPVEFETNGIKKLCITDNGCGMSDADMLRYLNNLSSSGSTQSIDGNYGIGAKISAYARNPAGVTYLSFQNNEGNLVQVWKDPISGEYGLRLISGHHVAPVPVQAIDGQPCIAEFGSGTHVVLHGMTDNEDTFSKSKDVPGRSAGQWVRRYLNTRYFRLPTNIEISCRTGGGGDEQFRYVTGQGPMLDAVALDKGTVALSGALARWWILPNSKTTDVLPKPIRLGTSHKDITAWSTLSPGYDTGCHVAAIYQDELHDTFRSNAARVLMQQFGILFGYEQLVIYIEPTIGAAPNMARTHLQIQSEPLPWSDWADEFRAKLPKGIKEFMDTVQPTKHDSRSEDERIKSVMDLFNVSKFKLDPTGDKHIATPDTGSRAPSNPNATRETTGHHGKKGGRAEPAYSSLINPNGPRGSDAASPQSLPDVLLVSAQDKIALTAIFGAAIAEQASERPEEMYPDQAGWFAQPNTINLSLDFGGLRDFVQRFVAEYPESLATRAMIAGVVLSWWSQTLKEAVHGLRTLAHSRVWTREKASTILTGESGPAILTTAVMPRYLVNQAIKREIVGKLGKLQSSKESE